MPSNAKAKHTVTHASVTTHPRVVHDAGYQRVCGSSSYSLLLVELWLKLKSCWREELSCLYIADLLHGLFSVWIDLSVDAQNLRLALTCTPRRCLHIQPMQDVIGVHVHSHMLASTRTSTCDTLDLLYARTPGLRKLQE